MPRNPPTRSRTARRARARIAVVVSRYNGSITGRLLEGAVRVCVDRTGAEPVVYDAPGSFELPVIAHAAASSGRFEGVVALGCLIKGETSHDAHIARAVAHGLVEASLRTGVPVTFGVLTVETTRQAEARAGGSEGNKGADAMNAAIDAVRAVRAAARGTEASGDAPARAWPDKAQRGRPA